jgi:hypothetical protein
MNKSKIPLATWDKAKALYQADKSLRDIEKQTGIDIQWSERKQSLNHGNEAFCHS